MTIDITLTEEEINKAICEYLNKEGLITSDFVMIKKYPLLNSYTFTNSYTFKNAKENDDIQEV